MQRAFHSDESSPFVRLYAMAGGQEGIENVIARRLPQRHLQRAIREARSSLLLALGEQGNLWLRLEQLIAWYRSGREALLFDLGYDHGYLEGRAAAFAAMAPDRSGSSCQARKLRALAEHVDCHHQVRASLLQAARAILLERL